MAEGLQADDLGHAAAAWSSDMCIVTPKTIEQDFTLLSFSGLFSSHESAYLP